MKWPLVLHILGALCVICAVAMVPSVLIASFETTNPAIGERTLWAFALSIVVSLAAGSGLWLATRRVSRQHFTATEGFAIAALGWILFSLLGGLPLYLSVNPTLAAEAEYAKVGMSPGPTFTYVDGVFEAMSGFTTTGSSVFGTCRSDDGPGRGAIEALPKSVLFWRSLTHWLGGMGIVVLCLALLPALRAGGYQMFQAEVPGPTADRFMPRVRETAAILWGVYVLLTAAETGLLLLGGMPLFDSMCHAFGTMATGGFSTKDLSIGHYAAIGHASAFYFEMVINVFMFLAGVNFILHYQALRLNFGGYRRNGEFRFYCIVLGLAIVLLTTFMQLCPTAVTSDFGTDLRQAVFQTLSITTTTGFCTADFDQWPQLCRALLVFLMFCGGCAGSTGGGMKQVRIMVVLEYAHRAVMRLLRPGLANRIRVGGESLPEQLVGSIIGLVLLWGIVFAVASVLLIPLVGNAAFPGHGMTQDYPLVTASTAVAATLNNIGPGLSGVGATCNYGWLPPSAKLLLILCMLMGRLEIYSVIVILLPLTWRR